MLNPVSLIPVIASLFLALLTTHVLARKNDIHSRASRFVSIDGLRGYLALFVFFHHSCMWYFYLKNGTWKAPPSNIYNNFGQSSVAFFFMITGFLFFTKIINDRTIGTDWIKLFVSRVLRLVPLYFLVVFLLFLTVAIVSKFSLNDTSFQLIKKSIKWLSFTMFGSPDLNGVESTSLIVAGVTWSLPYEWLFYLALPILALTVGNISSVPVLMLGFLGVAGFATLCFSPWHLSSFAGGIVAALLVRNERFCKFSSRRVASLALIPAVLLAMVLFPSTYAPIPLLLLSSAFALIAGGNTMFGALSSRISCTLGEMAYSIYLLHGIMLFVFFKFLIGFDRAFLLSASTHWLLIILITPVLVSTCLFTFRFIERPAMQRTEAVTAWIRTALRRKDNPRAEKGGV